MLRAGLIGLSSTGKTTLFQLLTRARHDGARSAGGQDASVAVAHVPDPRLDRLTALFTPKQRTPATVNFVDMATRRGFLGDESVPPGFSEVRGTVTIKSSASEVDLARLQEAVDRHCPVLDDLRRPVPVSLELRNEN